LPFPPRRFTHYGRKEQEMSKLTPLTYRDLAAKLKDLRKGRRELDTQIEAMIAILPKKPEDYDVDAKEWAAIKAALLEAVALIQQGINHLLPNAKC